MTARNMDTDHTDIASKGVSAIDEPFTPSPPLPPPHFNPLADSPPDVTHAVTPPTTSPSPLSPTTGPSGAWPTRNLVFPAEGSIPKRPDLLAVQRDSDDGGLSSPGTGSFGSAGTPTGSEGGDHLVEARDRLLLEGGGSDDSSGRSSTSEIPQATASIASALPPDLNLISPTPPLEPRASISNDGEAGPSRKKAIPSPLIPPDLPAEHAWDSVWPASGFVARPTVALGPVPHFSPVPVSPFITPTFSSSGPFPPHATRKQSSPIMNPVTPSRRPSSPSRISPRASMVLGESSRRSSSIDESTDFGPPAGSSSSHHRSLSGSGLAPLSGSITGSQLGSASGSGSGSGSSSKKASEMERYASPPGSPGRLSSISTTLPMDARPGSPIGVRWRKGGSISSRREVFGTSPPGLTSPLATARPRGSSFSTPLSPKAPDRHLFADQQQELAVDAIPSLPAPPPLIHLPSSFSLPPAVAPSPISLDTGDDGGFASNLLSPQEELLPRPTVLRRAHSDQDGETRGATLGQKSRSNSTTDLEKSPKRSGALADLVSPTTPEFGGELETTRTRKSPRIEQGNAFETVSPQASPRAGSSETVDSLRPPQESRPPVFVDEGDVLPTGDYQVDVTFDDEGLNTLERIFLLSKSDFSFHRAYVARVLGDLLEDVDPCESVEYVLPLLSGFAIDEDESVKEAFAEQMHKILWYFFSTCKITTEETETVVVTSAGLNVIPKPLPEDITTEIVQSNVYLGRRQSIISLGQSSGGSNLTQPTSSSTFASTSDTDTPNSIHSIMSAKTVYSPQPFVGTHVNDDSAKPPAELVVLPEILPNAFTPLLGSLLLNQNPEIAELMREGLVAIIGRLRGKINTDKWTRHHPDIDERKLFVSQTGQHAHDLRTFSVDARTMVENELVRGIVLGMGNLSTEMPDMLFDLDDGNAILDMYAGKGTGADTESGRTKSAEAEAFQLQLIQEAEAGRATSLILIGALCEVFSGQEVVDRGFVEEVLRAVDGDVGVRTEAAIAMAQMAKVVPVAFVYPMMPVFEAFSQDPQEIVRQSVANSLPNITRRLEEQDVRRDFAVAGITALYRAGDSCRCASLEILGDLIYIFHDDPYGPPKELLDIYTDDGDASEIYHGDCTWDIVASFNFPGVALTLGPDRWNELNGLFHRFQERAGEKVLTTIASFLHELSKILKPEQVAEDLLPVYTRCLEASDEIRERVYEHIDIFIAGLPDELAWMSYLGLCQAWKDGTLGGWRAREAVALHIPAFMEHFCSRVDDITPILKMTEVALLDRFAAVRDAATSSIPKAYGILAQTKFAEPFQTMLLDLSTSSHYRQRVTFTRCLREFIKPPPNRQVFEDFFAPALPRLRNDVVDVRLALAQIVADLFIVGAYYASQVHVPATIVQLSEALAVDESADVRYTVKNIDLKGFGRGEGLPHAIERPDMPDRSTDVNVESRPWITQEENTVERRKPPASDMEQKLGGMSLSKSLSSENTSLSATDSDKTPIVAQPPQVSGGAPLDPFASSFAKAAGDQVEELQDSPST